MVAASMSTSLPTGRPSTDRQSSFATVAAAPDGDQSTVNPRDNRRVSRDALAEMLAIKGWSGKQAALELDTQEAQISRALNGGPVPAEWLFILAASSPRCSDVLTRAYRPQPEISREKAVMLLGEAAIKRDMTDFLAPLAGQIGNVNPEAVARAVR